MNNGEQIFCRKKTPAPFFPFPAFSDLRVLIKIGRSAEVLCQTATAEAVNAILIPTHGHAGMEHLLLGSVGEKVVRHARCSVLVERE